MEQKQLPLALQLREDLTFTNFYVGEQQQLLVSYLQDFLQRLHDESIIYLWGKHVGRTHLLQACCHAVQKISVTYIPLADGHITPAILQDLENVDLVLMDDIDQVIGNFAWEEALFYFYNRLKIKGGRLMMTASVPPAHLKCVLPDLQSRLTQTMVFQIQELSDNEKKTVLIERAKQRGLHISHRVSEFLLKHCRRDMNNLMDMLEKLDQASIAAHRTVTVPFVKMVIANG